MPRKADAHLEGRILDAGLPHMEQTRRACPHYARVALASGTTTPTLYERFSNKDDLLGLLRRRARLNLFAAIKPHALPRKFAAAVLDFFAAHPNDFRLISEDWAPSPSPAKSTCLRLNS